MHSTWHAVLSFFSPEVISATHHKGFSKKLCWGDSRIGKTEQGPDWAPSGHTTVQSGGEQEPCLKLWSSCSPIFLYTNYWKFCCIAIFCNVFTIVYRVLAITACYLYKTKPRILSGCHPFRVCSSLNTIVIFASLSETFSSVFLFFMFMPCYKLCGIKEPTVVEEKFTSVDMWGRIPYL